MFLSIKLYLWALPEEVDHFLLEIVIKKKKKKKHKISLC